MLYEVITSSLDADSNNSEGILEEGAFYVWKKEELKNLLKEDYQLFSNYYNINDYGFWEHNNYVLIRKEEDSEFIKKYTIDKELLILKKKNWKYRITSYNVCYTKLLR